MTKIDLFGAGHLVTKKVIINPFVKGDSTKNAK